MYAYDSGMVHRIPAVVRFVQSGASDSCCRAYQVLGVNCTGVESMSESQSSAIAIAS